MSQSLPDEFVDRISAAVFAGRKIEAIKLYREATNVGLKEAKDFVEALEKRLRQETPEQFTVPPGGAGCSSSAAVIAMIGLAMYLFARGVFD